MSLQHTRWKPTLPTKTTKPRRGSLPRLRRIHRFPRIRLKRLSSWASSRLSRRHRSRGRKSRASARIEDDGEGRLGIRRVGLRIVGGVAIYVRVEGSTHYPCELL